jgi:hypothetical protein
MNPFYNFVTNSRVSGAVTGTEQALSTSGYPRKRSCKSGSRGNDRLGDGYFLKPSRDASHVAVNRRSVEAPKALGWSANKALMKMRTALRLSQTRILTATLS